MMSMFLKVLVTALMALVTTLTFAQALNARWHGTWKSSEDTLVITDQNFRMGKESCRWANAKPEKVTACVAFYDSTISKTQLLTQLEQVEKAIQEMLKTGNFKQAQKDRIHEAMGKNRQVLGAISNDTFRMVRTGSESKEKSGDCAGFYFLDQQTVYFVLTCTPAPEAYTVRAYKKE